MRKKLLFQEIVFLGCIFYFLNTDIENFTKIHEKRHFSVKIYRFEDEKIHVNLAFFFYKMRFKHSSLTWGVTSFHNNDKKYVPYCIKDEKILKITRMHSSKPECLMTGFLWLLHSNIKYIHVQCICDFNNIFST